MTDMATSWILNLMEML